MPRLSALLALALAPAAGCRCSPPPPPIDTVSRVPESGPLVLFAEVALAESATSAIRASYLVDPETGAAHRLREVDAFCGTAARYNEVTRELQSLEVAAFSPDRQLLFLTPQAKDEAPVSLSLDGQCTDLWREPAGVADREISVSGDGKTVARLRDGAVELRATDGGAARTLAWSRTLPGGMGAFELSPTADRIAITQAMDGPSGGTERVVVLVCDEKGDCARVYAAGARGIGEMRWSPDGTRLAFRIEWRNDVDALEVVDVAHAGQAPIEIDRNRSDEGGDRGSNPGHIAHFAWSPDGRRLALASSHAGGCSLEVRDLGSTCYEGLYVVGADGKGLRTVRSDLFQSGVMFWIR